MTYLLTYLFIHSLLMQKNVLRLIITFFLLSLSSSGNLEVVLLTTSVLGGYLLIQPLTFKCVFIL